MKKFIFALLTVVLAVGVATAKESILDTYNMNRAYEEGNDFASIIQSLKNKQ